MVHEATSDPDTACAHQAMQEPDKTQFVKAMKKEARDQSENGNFAVMHKSKLPKGVAMPPAAWQMKCRGDTRIQQIKKHKSRLDAEGSCMKKGIHCNEMRVPQQWCRGTQPACCLLQLRCTNGARNNQTLRWHFHKLQQTETSA